MGPIVTTRYYIDLKGPPYKVLAYNGPNTGGEWVVAECMSLKAAEAALKLMDIEWHIAFKDLPPRVLDFEVDLELYGRIRC